MKSHSGEPGYEGHLEEVFNEQYVYYQQQTLLENQSEETAQCQLQGREEEEKRLRSEIAQMEGMAKSGIRLTLDGVSAVPEIIAKVCMIRERGCYMRDYIADSDGKIVEVRFDRLS